MEGTNNFFSSRDLNIHVRFVNYLLRFATSEISQKDPMLSACANNIFRYILDIPDGKALTVRFLEDSRTFVVNETEYVYISRFSTFGETITTDYALRAFGESFSKEQFLGVYYDPEGYNDGSSYMRMTVVDDIIFWLSRNGLRNILRRYPAEDTIVFQYLEWLNMRLQDLYLEKPIEDWNRNDNYNFAVRLLEEGIIDRYQGLFIGEEIRWSYRHPEYFGIEDKNIIYFYLEKGAIKCGYVTRHISCYLEENYIALTAKLDKLFKGITIDVTNYREKFQYAQSVFGGLKGEL